MEVDQQERYAVAHQTRCTERAYLMRLALPIVIENLLQVLLGTIDLYFAGDISDDAIAGIGVTNIIMNVLIAFFVAVGTGSVALVSRRYGRSDSLGASAATSSSISLALILGVVIGVICLVASTQFLTFAGLPDSLITLTRPYFLAVSVPCVFLAIEISAASCLRALEDTKSPMFVTGTANVFNILLNVIFIVAGLGLLGLGCATSICRALSAIALLMILSKKPVTQLALSNVRFSDIRVLAHIGCPAGLERLAQRLGQFIYTAMIVSLGTNAYVAHNIAGAIEAYAYIPAMGFGLATSTIVGVALGKREANKARSGTWMAWRVATAFMLLIAALFFIFAPQLVSLFSSSLDTQRQAIGVLRLIALFQPCAALVQVMGGALQGAGDTQFPLYATIMGIWGVRLGIGYVLAIPLEQGLMGIWYAYALDLVMRGTLLAMRFRQGAWKEIRL